MRAAANRSLMPGLLAAALLAPLPSARAAAGGEDGDVPTVRVVGHSPLPGLGVDPDELPYTVQSAGRGDLEAAHASTSVDYLLQDFDGVNVNEVQGNAYLGDLSYRGFRASPTLGAAQGLSVYLDGVRINEPFGDVVNWDLLPEAALQRVTLSSGSNPVYGLNALGGALSFATRSGLSQQGLEAEASYGDADRRRATLSYGARSEGGWHGFAAASGYAEEGWREHSASRLGNVFAKLGRHTQDDDLALSALHGRSRLLGNGLLPSWRIEDDGREDGLYEDDRRAVYTYPDRNENRLTQLTLSGEHRFDTQTLLSAVAYLRRGTRNTVNGDINEAYEEYADACEDGFDADGAPLDDECPYSRDEGAALHSGVLNTTHAEQRGAGLALNFSRRAGAHDWLLGASYDGSRVDYAQYAQDGFVGDDRGVSADPAAPRAFFSGVDGRARTAGLYGSDIWTLAAGTHLTASLRWNHAELRNRLSTENGGAPAETFRYVRLNPAAGLTRALGPRLTLYGGWSQNSRAPSVVELGCADPDIPCRLPTGLQADPYLKQVIARTVELGARWRPRRRVAASLALFRTDNRDDILFLRAPNTQQGYFANFPKTRYQGGDLSVRGALGSLRLALGYSFLDASYQARRTLAAGERDVDVHPGTRIAGLPKHTVRLTADWTPLPPLRLGAELFAASALLSSGNEDGRIDNEGGADARQDWHTAGYALLDLRASWTLPAKLELYARVDNVLDRRYETFGAVADDVIPDGELLRPHEAPGEAAATRFVAPGAPRLWVLGLRWRYGGAS